jgi:CMP-N,N'-diacetyllegionaminic acid synthase
VKTVVLVPARAGSKRVVDKNIRILRGKPLMVWSILAGLEIGEVYVSTDSKEYGEIAVGVGAKIVYRDHADDNQSDIDVVGHFIDHVHCDTIVYLRPTTPVRSVGLVQEAVRVFTGTGLRSVEEMGESAYKCFEVDCGRLIPVYVHGSSILPVGMSGLRDYTDKPNHLCPKTYHPNGYVDIIRSLCVKNGSLWGPDKQAFVTPRTIEIDTEDDLAYAEYYMTRFPDVKYTIGKEKVDG